MSTHYFTIVEYIFCVIFDIDSYKKRVLVISNEFYFIHDRIKGEIFCTQTQFSTDLFSHIIYVILIILNIRIFSYMRLLNRHVLN